MAARRAYCWLGKISRSSVVFFYCRSFVRSGEAVKRKYPLRVNIFTSEESANFQFVKLWWTIITGQRWEVTKYKYCTSFLDLSIFFQGICTLNKCSKPWFSLELLSNLHPEHPITFRQALCPLLTLTVSPVTTKNVQKQEECILQSCVL